MAAPGSSESAPQRQRGSRPGRLAAGRTVAPRQDLSPTSSLVGRDGPISASFKKKKTKKPWRSPIAWYALLTESLGVVVEGG